MKHILIFFLLTCLIQCKDVVEEMDECAALSTSPTSYSIQVYPIVSNVCAIPQCHVTGSQHGNFTVFQDVKDRVEDGRLKFMIETHQMPHGFTKGPRYLTSCEIETIKKWISEGAKNN
jgi:hypothetical protein